MDDNLCGQYGMVCRLTMISGLTILAVLLGMILSEVDDGLERWAAGWDKRRQSRLPGRTPATNVIVAVKPILSPKHSDECRCVSCEGRVNRVPPQPCPDCRTFIETPRIEKETGVWSITCRNKYCVIRPTAVALTLAAASEEWNKYCKPRKG